MYELIRKNINYIQKKLNLKNNDFAKQLGISKSAYSNYIKEPTLENPTEYKPKLNILLKISNISKYSLNDILENYM